MTYAQEHADLEQHFDTQWADATPVQYENEGTFSPPANHAPYVRFFVVDGEAFTAGGRSNTQRRYRHPGIVQIDILTKQGIGGATARQLADQASQIFRGQRVGNILFRAPAVDNAPPEGGYHKLVVTIRFQRDELL